MRLRTRDVAVFLVACLGACTTQQQLATLEQNVGVAERQIIGLADPYPADATMREREALLKSSIVARREMAWSVVAKVLAPVALNAKEISLLNEATPTLPRFETWYQKDEIKRMFHQLYKSHGSEGRLTKAPFSPAQLSDIFDWNARYLSLSGLPADLYTGRLDKLKDDADVAGLSSAEAVSFSPALVKHLFANYGPVLDCLKPAAVGESANRLSLVQPNDPPLSVENNFTLCFNDEFPIDAVVTKSSWSNSFAEPELPVFDTGADALRTHLHGSADDTDGSWGSAPRKASPSPSEIHTARLQDGTLMRLTGLHIVTKELRHWVWITLWWSDTPDSDFGADRPASIAALGGAFSHYKMNVVVDFKEGDPDPRGGVSDVSLGDALASSRADATWASNAYIEKGPMNARSNCIGCHQHAGTPLDPAVTMADEASYPANGRALMRNNFPADYLWAFDNKKTRLARIIQGDVDAQDARDPR